MAIVKRTCSIEGCTNKHFSRIWCKKHYQRWYRNGDPLVSKNPAVGMSLQERLEFFSEKHGDCIIWTNTLTYDGYPIVQHLGRKRRVHRLVWEQANGPIPEGMHIDHTCFNRACINLVHLRVATNKQNNENLSYKTSKARSGVRGVHWISDRKKWRVTVKHYGKAHTGGYFDTISEAEQSAIALRNKLFTHNDLDRI